MPFPYLTRGSSIRTRARTHRVNESLQHSHTAEATTAQRLLAAAAADKPNSSSSSTQQWRQRGSGGGQLRARGPRIVRLMTPCLGGCALTYASGRDVHTHKVNKTLNTRTQQKQQQHNDYWQQKQTGPTAIAPAPSSGGGATAGVASYERASLHRRFDDSVPWWLRLAWVCLGLSRVFYVVCRLCCVTCALRCLLAVSYYDTYIHGHVYVAPWFFCYY